MGGKTWLFSTLYNAASIIKQPWSSLFHWTQALYDYYDSPSCNHGPLELRTIKTKSGSHHIIILPNANMLVHKDKA